jgi:hypothetical protein
VAELPETGFVYDKGKTLVALRHKGTSYELTGVGDDEFKEVEAHLMKNRLNPIDAIKDQLEAIKGNQTLTDALLDRAYRDMRKGGKVDAVTRQDVFDFLNTREGAAMSIWMMVRKTKPDATIADAEKILAECATAEGDRKRAEDTEKSGSNV